MRNENLDIVRQYIENIVNTGNADELSAFISPRYTEVHQNRRYQLGIEGVKKTIAGIRETYPDLKISIDMQIAEGEWVVTSYIMKGTQLGSWIGTRPSGKAVEIQGVSIDRVVNGKIIEHGSSANLLDPLIEINQYPKNWIKESLQKIFVSRIENSGAVCEPEAA